MKKTNLFITATLLLGLVFTTNAFAQGEGDIFPPVEDFEILAENLMLDEPLPEITPDEAPQRMKQGKHRPDRGQRFGLDLTDEQKEQMKQLRLEGMKAAKPLQDELRELAARHKTLVTAEKADMNAINKSIDKMSAIKTQMAKMKAKKHQEVRELLTEEQRMKFDRMVSMKRGKHGMREGKHGAHARGHEGKMGPHQRGGKM